MRTMKQIRENLGDLIQHFAWAVFGQECDCGHNPFNRLARWSASRAWLSCYDDELEPLNWQTAAAFWLGSRLGDFSIWLMHPENRAARLVAQQKETGE